MALNTPTPDAVDSRLVPSASWLYWVAGLSAINSIIHAFGGDWTFSLGLGVTQLLTGLGDALGALAKPVTYGTTAAIILGLCFLGYLACRGVVWAFIVGIIVLALDCLLLIPFASEMWLSIAFHIWAIVSLIGGLKLAKAG